MKKQVSSIVARGKTTSNTPVYSILVYRDYSGIQLYRQYNASPSSVGRVRKLIANGMLRERVNCWGIVSYDRVGDRSS